ncbi:MAG: hypothetical protein KKG33_11060 [candidate division Zixibacteria bacterium]|nr:hypothetical protein [candidate division Zixibacteria bacterium]MBU1469697.1 hypothetical protein [candidate division Zixibacteria bacterium]MBU2626087.1 hypothetical protein [candidate division Zixibacteria bacterium]
MWIFLSFALLSLTSAVSAEIVVVTRPLPDLQGDVWPREYFDVNHVVFDIPQGVTFTAGAEPSPIRPGVTRRAAVKNGRSVVEDAWVNIIDVVNKRFYAGNLKRWYDLDSIELIQIRDGYDTCAVYFRTCDRLGAPPDSCRTFRTLLHDSLSMSDIVYIVFTAFDWNRDVDLKAYARSQYYFRSLLGYVTRDIPLSTLLDISSAEVTSWPIECGCLHDFKPQSIRRVVYLSDTSEK